MMWSPAGFVVLAVVLPSIGAATWQGGSGEEGAVDRLRLFLIRSILAGGGVNQGVNERIITDMGNQVDNQEFRYPDSHEDPVTPLPKFNIPTPEDRMVGSKRAVPGSDLSAALPPWQEFCRMLEMRNCKRFRRSLPDPATMHRMLREKEKLRK